MPNVFKWTSSGTEMSHLAAVGMLKATFFFACVQNRLKLGLKLAVFMTAILT